MTPAAAVEPPDGVPGGLQLVKEDLQFILKQIKVAEADPGGKPQIGPGETQVVSPLAGTGLRTVTGVHNNLLEGQEYYGAADQPFPRRLSKSFGVADPTCTGPVPGPTTSYSQNSGIVCDAEPRTVSNLIVDQTTANPAAVAAATRQGTEADLIDVDDNPATAPNGLFIPNTATDAGLSARSNAWFTFFGQFFDHGLDLVTKGGGTVIVPLQPDDSLYRDPAGPDLILGTADDIHTNFMVLTRATNLPGPDGVLGTADDIREHTNTTTPFVDQNQTYTSHPSHQVFLREYAMVGGVPVATGNLLDAPDSVGGGLARWIDVKEQSQNLLGVTLQDTDIFNVPLVQTDLYGKFTPDTDGSAVLMGGGTGHAFLDDIAHHAVPDTHDADHNPATPGVQKVEDTDTDMGDDNNPATYDDETLDAHYVTGDGRGNENIGLTAVHHVFHSEHNRVVEQVKTLVDEQTDDVAFQDEWKLAAGPGGWNGERLFQAARLVTEMQYQHLVFEEFARKISPAIEVLPRNESGYNPTIDPAIVAEFAHVVYRFGHSMLTEDVRRTMPDGTANDLTLFDAFLNPMAFTDGGNMTADEGAGAIVRGNIREVANEIDEFVTDALRNRLVGLPLDLPTLNMARARDTGVPGLNEARRQFFNESQNSTVEPYTSWNDFRAALRNSESLVNFVAAYGTHPALESADTVVDKRAAADLLVNGGVDAPADRVAFMEGSGAWESTASVGLEEVDFWVGGLAERAGVFGSMLGSTFNYIFQSQLEALQFGDRFYYLSRLNGTNLLGQLENNSFSALISRNTDASYLPADVFATPDCVIDLSQVGPNDPLPSVAACGDGARLEREPNGNVRFFGTQHSWMIGSQVADRLQTDEGDDTIQGTGGNDRIEGGDGNDGLFGGDGDDYISDIHGDDVIKAGAGSDRINAGPGLDLLFGASGKDFISHGTDATESFAGIHDDFILGGTGNDVIAGNLGDDWMEGRGGTDLQQGDNANTLQNDPAGGDDVMIDQTGNDDYDAEGGDDIMVSTAGANRNHGMLGFDWVTNARSSLAADDDMTLIGDTPLPGKPFADRFDLVEGLSGWDKDDILRGDNRSNGVDGELAFTGHELTDLAKIAGLDQVLGADVTQFGGGNILLGGLGSDLIQGRGGDDVIDGDAWLNVKLDVNGQSYTSLTQLQSAIFAGTVSPRDITIVREVINAAEPASGLDTAVYSGNFLEYTITPGLSRTEMVISHVAGLATDGTDTVRNIEYLQFADQTIPVFGIGENQPPSGTITISDTTPAENQTLTVTENVTDPDGIVGDKALVWQFESVPGTWTQFAFGASSGALSDAVVGKPIRVEVNFTDGLGKIEVLASQPTAKVVNVNDAPTGDPLVTPAAATEGEPFTADASGIADEDGLGEFGYRWQQSAVGGGGTYTTIGGATADTYTPGAAQVNRRIRVVVTYTDGFGTPEQVASDPTGIVGDSYTGTAGANSWTGTAGPDKANGLAGADSLNGQAGNDQLTGGAGNDTVNGGADDDVFLVGPSHGIDTINGGSGNDRVEATAASTAIGVSSFSGVETFSSGGFASVTINGTGGADTFDFTDVVLDGIAGINGLGGADTLTGSSGDDTINGGAGSNTVSGGSGNDTLSANGGVDSFRGGAGDDTITAGAGLDSYLFGEVGGLFGNDTVVGFDANPSNGQEFLTLTGLGVTGANFGGRVTVAYSSATGTTVTIVNGVGDTLGTITLPGVGATPANSITSADFIL